MPLSPIDYNMQEGAYVFFPPKKTDDKSFISCRENKQDECVLSKQPWMEISYFARLFRETRFGYSSGRLSLGPPSLSEGSCTDPETRDVCDN